MTSQKISLTSPVPAMGSMFGRLLQVAMARQAHRRSLTALAQLDDRLLCDIGLTRAEADAGRPLPRS